MNVRFPQVKVKLTGEDGNAFAIVGRVIKAMKTAGVEQVFIDQYRAEAMKGNYDNLLRVSMHYVEVE